MESEPKMKLDKKDKKILDVLDRNARLSIAEISRKTGIKRDSILYRLRKMKKEGVIRFFHAVLDPVKLGYPIYAFVNFILHNLNEEKERKFISFLEHHPNVVYVVKTTGKWDIMINVAAKDLIHFNKIIEDIRRKFSEIIKDYDSSFIIKEYKYDRMVNLIDGE